MATQTTTAKATEAKGFGGLCCIGCGGERTLRVRLDDVTATDAIHCDDCGEDYSLSDVRSAVQKWARVLAWLDTMPDSE